MAVKRTFVGNSYEQYSVEEKQHLAGGVKKYKNWIWTGVRVIKK